MGQHEPDAVTTVSKHKRLSLAALAAAVVSLAVGLAYAPAAHAAPGGDCSDNSIIKCGVTNATDFVAKARANQPADLQAVYTKFGITPEEYDAFAKQAVMGTAKTNGEIVANGQVVATGAYSIGRTKFEYSTPYAIGNTTYYKSANNQVLKEDMPAMLWFDSKGKLDAAILSACGNPIGGNSTTPAYSCRQLSKQAVGGKQDTYSFTVEAPASKGAVFTKVVYDFGDGTSVTKTSAIEAVEHAYTQPGTYTAKATVYFRLPDGREVSASGSGCSTAVTVKAPPAPTPTPPAPAPQPTLPSTGPMGMAGISGLFAGSSALGAAGYRWRSRRRTAKANRVADNLLRTRD